MDKRAGVLCLFAQLLCGLNKEAAAADSTCQTDSFQLHSIFADGMVLQAEPQVGRIFGFASADSDCPVEVTRICQHQRGMVVENRSTSSFQAARKPEVKMWQVEFPPTANGVVCDIVATQGSKTRRVSDARYGDVWLCIGLSNMKAPLSFTNNATEEREQFKNYSNIKMSVAYTNFSDVEQDDFEARLKHWYDLGENEDGALCYLFMKYLTDIMGKSHVLGYHLSTAGGSSVGAWMSREALDSCPSDMLEDRLLEHRSEDTYIWNARIHPLLKFPIKGVLLSMGEYDMKVTKPGLACRYRALVDSYRRSWQTSPKTGLPIGFELLRYPLKNSTENFPLYRWHQTADQGVVPNDALPGVFMADSLDIVDEVFSYHPGDKQRLARRLSIAAANVAYGLTDYPAHGPFPAEMVKKGTEFLVRYPEPFFHNPADPTTGFYVCCRQSYAQCDSEAKSDWHWQRVRIGSTLVNSVRDEIRVDLIGQCNNTEAAELPVGIAFLYAGSPVERDGQAPLYTDDEFRLPAMPWKRPL